MNVALRRGYGYAYGPKILRRAGYGMQGIGDTCIEWDEAGNCIGTAADTSTTPTVALDLSCPTGQISDGAGGCIPTTLTSTPTTTATSTVSIVDSTGITWTCDPVTGNCCDPSMNCQQGPPGTLTTAPANATAAQSASASAANQSNAALIAAIANAAVAATKAATTASGSIACGNGVAVPVGHACPGAAAGQVCPTGMTLSGTTCSTGILGMSTSTLLLIGVALFAFMAIEGGGKRR